MLAHRPMTCCLLLLCCHMCTTRMGDEDSGGSQLVAQRRQDILEKVLVEVPHTAAACRGTMLCIALRRRHRGILQDLLQQLLSTCPPSTRSAVLMFCERTENGKSKSEPLVVRLFKHFPDVAASVLHSVSGREDCEPGSEIQLSRLENVGSASSFGSKHKRRTYVMQLQAHRHRHQSRRVEDRVDRFSSHWCDTRELICCHLRRATGSPLPIFDHLLRSPNHVGPELRRARHHTSDPCGATSNCCRSSPDYKQCMVSSINDDPQTDSPYLWNDLSNEDKGVECNASITRIPGISNRDVLKAISGINTDEKPNVLASPHVKLPINALWYEEGFYYKFRRQIFLHVLYIASNCVFGVSVTPGTHQDRKFETWLMMVLLTLLALYHGRHELCQLQTDGRKDYFSGGWNIVQILCVMGSLTSVILVSCAMGCLVYKF